MELSWFSFLLSWYYILPVLIGVIYWHLTNTFRHWKNRNIYHLEPVIFFGNIKDRILFRTSFHEFQLQIYNKFKGNRIAGLYEGRKPTLICLDPDIIRHILVKDFDHFVDRPTFVFRDSPYVQQMLFNLKGSEWKYVRHLLTPAFSSGKLKAMQSLVETVAGHLVVYLEELMQLNGERNSAEIEIKDLFGRFTTDVIASCAFGVDCDSFNKAKSEFVKNISVFNEVPMPSRIALFAVILFFPGISKYLPLSFFNMASINFLGHIVKDVKKQREKDAKLKRNDFLQLMLDAADDELDLEDSNKEGRDRTFELRKFMSEECIIAQSVLFLLAGFETSNTMITFACYELALNMEIQDKLRSKILKVLDKNNGELSYSTLCDMTYLENVLLETLRKYPPVASINRKCTQMYTIPGTDVVLNVGDSAAIPIMGLHYDPEYYPNPEVFDPERFNAEKKNERSRYVFLPFGAGPRNCIGLRFAMMSAKILLVNLLKDYKIQRCPKTSVPFEYSKYSVFLKPKNGIWLSIEKI